MRIRRYPQHMQGTPGAEHYLVHGEYPADDQEAWWDAFEIAGAVLHRPAVAEAQWQNIRDRVVAAWITARPGSRPWAWWRFDAPQGEAPAWLRGTYQAGWWRAPRRQLGGPAEGRVWPGDRAFGVPREFPSGARYESEAVYLARHGRLTAEERRRLTSDGGEDA